MSEETITLNELAGRLAEDGEQIYLPGCEHPAPNQIHRELPDGLIDLPSASREFDIPLGTLSTWIHKGELPRRGRLHAPAAGGGYVVTEIARIKAKLANPSKRGRKRKK